MKDSLQRTIEFKFYAKKYGKYFKTIKDQEVIKTMDFILPIDSLFIFSMLANFKIFTTTLTAANELHFLLPSSHYFWFHLCLRVNLTKVYFPRDMFCNINDSKVFLLVPTSCYLTNYNVMVHTEFLTGDPVKSLSLIFFGFSWVEREVKEFFNIFFWGLKDTRRLLTDYVSLSTNNSEYKTTPYNHLIQDIINIKLLQWLYILAYLFLCCTVSFIFLNKNLLSLIVISEVIIVLLYLSGLLLSSCINMYFLVGFSFFILILGGLEIALNLLISIMT